MNIIGLNGRKSAGKNVVGTYLRERYGFTEASFAALLKQSAAALFDIPVERWEDLKNREDAIFTLGTEDEDIANCTVRVFLQRYGTEAHRDIFDTDFWVKAAIAKLDENGGPYVFTDARFDNELREVRRWGGINVRLLRDAAEDGDTHVSEADPDPTLIDALIDNNGTIEELYLSVDAVMFDVYKGN